MRLIVLTTDTIFPDEASVLNCLLSEGTFLLHLRKPLATEKETAGLLQAIQPEYYNRIVLHDHFGLLDNFPLKGVHLNSRHPVCDYQGKISVSRSCHSLESVKRAVQEHDYLFLSPIFDSISKQGYQQNFTHQQLLNAGKEGIINEKVIALGGISEETLPLIQQYGFGGAAVLGAIWRNFTNDKDLTALVKRLHRCYYL